MNIFKKVAGLFPAPKTQADNATRIYARCNHCGETLTARVNSTNDLSRTDEGGYFARKVLIGNRRCFRRIEVNLHFDPARHPTRREISGGVFISEAEYRAERD